MNAFEQKFDIIKQKAKKKAEKNKHHLCGWIMHPKKGSSCYYAYCCQCMARIDANAEGDIFGSAVDKKCSYNKRVIKY